MPSISSTSLEKLESIAAHPHIGKGVRTIRLSTCIYTPVLAGDFTSFAWYAINRVFGAAVQCQEGIQAERRRVEQSGTAISEALFRKWMDRIAALEDVMEVLKSWSRLTAAAASGGGEALGSPLFPPPRPGSAAAIPRARDENEERRHVMLLRIAHALYRSRFQDQEMLLADGGLVERFARAMARMPRAKVLEIVDFKHEDRDCSICQSSATAANRCTLPEETDLYDTLLDVDSFIQPSSWDEAITHRWSTTPPVELLFKLPVAIQQAGVTLDRIAYSTGVCTEEYYPLLTKASTEDFLGLSSAVKNLGIKSFAFMQGDEVRPFARRTPSSEDVRAFKRFVTAMSNSDRLERLRVRLGGGWSDGSLDPEHRHNLGDLLWPPAASASTSASLKIGQELRAPWGQTLRDVSITGIPFTISDLDNLAKNLQSSGAQLDFLSLSRVCLISGSWKDALDTLRNIQVKCEKSLFAPTGAECDDVTMTLTERYEKIFCAEPGSGSVAECYINGEVKRNPLKSGWAVDFVYSVDGDEVVVSVVSSEEDSEDEGEEDSEDEEEETDDEDTEVGEEEVEETALYPKGVEGPVFIVGEEMDVWDEMPSVEHIEYA